MFLIAPLRPIVAEVPANLIDAYGNLFDIGVAIPSATLSDAEQVALGANFTAITPENSMKAAAIHPEEGRYDFRGADEIVKLAQRRTLRSTVTLLFGIPSVPIGFLLMGGSQPAASWC